MSDPTIGEPAAGRGAGPAPTPNLQALVDGATIADLRAAVERVLANHDELARIVLADLSLCAVVTEPITWAGSGQLRFGEGTHAFEADRERCTASWMHVKGIGPCWREIAAAIVFELIAPRATAEDDARLDPLTEGV